MQLTISDLLQGRTDWVGGNAANFEFSLVEIELALSSASATRDDGDGQVAANGGEGHEGTHPHDPGQQMGEAEIADVCASAPIGRSVETSGTSDRLPSPPCAAPASVSRPSMLDPGRSRSPLDPRRR